VTDKERVLQHLRQRLVDASRSLQYAEDQVKHLQAYIRRQESELAKVQDHDDPVIMSEVLEMLELGEGEQ
jgi:hypothetical protein